MGGDYDDFKMATTPLEEKSHNFLNGDVLIGIDDPYYDEEFDQREYDREWNHYFGNIQN